MKNKFCFRSAVLMTFRKKWLVRREDTSLSAFLVTVLIAFIWFQSVQDFWQYFVAIMNSGFCCKSLKLTCLNTDYRLSLIIGIILRWGFLIWELFFYLLLTFCSHLGSLCIVSSSLCFGQISPLAFFRWLTTTSDRKQLWKAVITGDTVTRLSIPIQGRG